MERNKNVALLLLLFGLFFPLGSRACIQVLDGWKQVGLEERAKRCPIVFHGLAIEAIPAEGNPFSYSVQFWLINVYKGSESVGNFLNLDPGSGGVFNLRDRKINVTGFSYKSKCHNAVSPQKYYIIFSEVRGNELVAKFDDLFGASAEWSEKNEKRIWHGVGWENWSDWGTCSVSCGEGFQERFRKCFLKENGCKGYNKERRRCNMFSCQGAVDPIRLDDRRFFHSSRGEWQRVYGRPSAWKLRPNSYVWVPSSQIFPNKSTNRRPGIFPREFSLLVTLKLSPKKPLQGILFSLRSRREQNAYLSLELESADRIRVVHAGKNGTQSVAIPMKLNDGHWHQLGIALQDDDSVRSFVDCAWVSTDILKRNELDHPEDADLIIGYLFQGELEQLVIVPNPGAVAQQCSSTKIPIYDPAIDDAVAYPTASKPAGKAEVKGHAGNESETKFEFFDYENLEKDERGKKAKFPGDEEQSEGSGNGPQFNITNYEVEWSNWSPCSSTCGPGLQARYSRCVDDGSRLEFCLESGSERTETRACVSNDCGNVSGGNFSLVDESKKWQPAARRKTIAVPITETDDESETDSRAAETNRDGSRKSQSDFSRKSSTVDVLNTSDIYFFENRTAAAKMHRNRGKIRGRKIQPKGSWDMLKRRLLRGNGSKKNWCSCLNGGTCDPEKNYCRCPEGFRGRFCEKVECQTCENVECQFDCLNGGKCLEGNVCGCPSGYHGNRCENPECNPPCRNGGTCIKPDTCLCPAQTTGSYCQNYFCRFPCQNGGSCVGPDQCECPHNATGKNCENPVCQPPCENGATCSKGNWCLCDSGSYGIRCEKRKCEYVAVKEPFTRGFKRLTSKKTETKCESLTWKTCTRTMPEYQTIYKTFYRTVYKCKEDIIGDEKHQ